MAPTEDDGDADGESGAGWRDLMSGKIRKRTVVHGSGPCPEVKQDVICSFQVRLADGPESYSPEVVQHYKNVRYRIGESEAPPCLELALRYMRAGEEADVYGSPNFAFGPEGCPAVEEFEEEIPPDAALCLYVVLHEVLEIPGDELDWNDRIQEVAWRKANGNRHFKRRSFAKAQKCYKEGMDVFADGFEPPEHIKDRQSAMAAAMQLVTDCCANIAAVHLERGDNVAAKQACTEALTFSPSHVKALYRAAKACLALDEFEECEAAIKKALSIEPDSAVVMRVGEELRRKKKVYEAKSKKMNQRLFQGLDYPDEPPKEAKEVLRGKDRLEPPSWLEWIKEDILTEMLDQVDWGFAAAGAACVLLCILACLLAPPRYLTYILMAFVLGFPITTAAISIRRADAVEAKKQA
mmetsp:Transcript_635/g.1790  ORF Transcript_635/g.1790 Transcript_635/m.1790 type:complete len:409 (-) Transcript_635:62-1288(-)